MKMKTDMKKGWEMKKLGDVCYSKSSNVSQNQLANEVGNYPIFGASGLIKNVSFYHRDKPYLSIVKDGSGFGRITKMEAFTSVIGTLQYILPNDEIDLDYLNYSLMSVDFKKYVQGAAIPHIYFKDYKNEPFLFMPRSEQQRIVSILDEAFAAIFAAKANAEQNLKNAKELFESYLQGVFEKKGDGWEHTRLGDICQINDGTHFSPENTSEGKYMYITAKNIKPYFIDLTKISYISEKDHKEIYARCSPVKGDVLYIKDGATAGIATLNTLDEEFSLLSSVALLKCSSKIMNTFLVHYMNSTIGKKNFLGYIDGAAITRLTLIKIKNVCFSLPPIKAQQIIVQKLDALSVETKRLEAIYQQKCLDLEELKKSVLQKAFNGEL
jgi:type I restriction enzyme S subunit